MSVSREDNSCRDPLRPQSLSSVADWPQFSALERSKMLLINKDHELQPINVPYEEKLKKMRDVLVVARNQGYLREYEPSPVCPACDNNNLNVSNLTTSPCHD